jgi:hypothetical protein
MLRAGRSGFRIPVEARDISLLRNVQAECVIYSVSCSKGTGIFLGIKVAGMLSCPLPSSAEMKRKWGYSSVPLFAFIVWAGQLHLFLPLPYFLRKGENLRIEITYVSKLPIPVAAQSKAWVCGLSLAGRAGSNPAGGMDVCLL